MRIADQVADGLGSLFPNDHVLLGTACVAEVGAIEGQVDIFGEAPDSSDGAPGIVAQLATIISSYMSDLPRLARMQDVPC
jgi:hypothetical protein